MTTVEHERVKVYKFGEGLVKPYREVDSEELLRDSERSQKPVTDPHVVCIDDREAIEAQPVREKIAGGALTTGYAVAYIGDWSMFTESQRRAGPAEQVDAVASYLVKAGEELGGHIDNHATETNSNCGAAEGLPAAVGIIGAHGNDEAFVAQMKDVLGDNYDQAVWDKIIETSAEKASTEHFKDWSGMTIIKSVRDHDGVIEVLNGDNTMPHIDPENILHNHFAEFVSIRTEPGMSNDRDKSDRKFFQVDVPAVVRVAERMSKDREEFVKNLHIATGFQFAIKYKLTKDLPNIQ